MTNTNPSEVLREARELAERGAYGGALTKYLWFHENALQHDPSLYGVRRSYALREWAQLGDVFPPARAMLESVRDKKATALREGLLDRELFRDVASIDETLSQAAHTSALFVQIASSNREFAGKCFRSALPGLVRTGNFALARSFISSPRESLDRMVYQLHDNVDSLQTAPKEAAVLLYDAYVKIYIEDVLQLLAVLVGVGETDESRLLSAIAVESIKSSDIRDQVREALARPLDKEDRQDLIR